MSGYYHMHRGWMDNPIFKNEPYTEREAWLYLIEIAAWKPHKFRRGNDVFDLERGQIATSVKALSGRFGWGKRRVDGFLKRLKSGNMIGKQTGSVGTLITICNYDKYQSLGETEGTEKGKQKGKRRGSGGETKEEGIIREEEGNKEIYANSYSEKFLEFWAAWPKRGPKNDPKKPAGKIFDRLVRNGTDPDVMIAGAKSYAESQSGGDPQFNCMAQTWLNQERWDNVIDDWAERDAAAEKVLAEHYRMVGFVRE